jgi:hypothetical protein
MCKGRVFVYLKGGMGNQMFQHAAGRALAARNQMEFAFDVHSGFACDRVYRRTFSLGGFPLHAESG